MDADAQDDHNSGPGYDPLEYLALTLKCNIRAIALKRMEDAARSISDFNDVVKQWDHLDDNRERKERYHEIGHETLAVIQDASPLDIIIPTPINHTYWRQIMKGDFIDAIFNCPFEMHESLTDEDYSQIIYDLKDEDKELIYSYISEIMAPNSLLLCEITATATSEVCALPFLDKLLRRYFSHLLTDWDRIFLLPAKN